MTVPSHPGLKPGDVLDGKYVLRTCVGRGGMGSVFLADQPELARKVAIKVLHPELADCALHAQRLRKEAVAACRVKSPHCVTVIDCCALPGGGWYLVMEYVPGRSLGRVLAEEPMALDRAAALFEQVLAALAAVHASGLVHADVKSDNFLVETVGGRDRVTMIDFGLARVPGSHAWLDLDSDIVLVSGTPEYMAPEIVGGEPPMPTSDLYAAGVILYELLTAAPPFTGGTAAEVMIRHTREGVIPPSQARPDRDIPWIFDRLVLRALDKRPDMRFTDAAAFLAELRAAMAAVRSPHDRHELAGREPTSAAGAGARPAGRRFARGSTGGDDLPRATTARGGDRGRERSYFTVEQTARMAPRARGAGRGGEPAAGPRAWLMRG